MKSAIRLFYREITRISPSAQSFLSESIMPLGSPAMMETSTYCGRTLKSPVPGSLRTRPRSSRVPDSAESGHNNCPSPSSIVFREQCGGMAPDSYISRASLRGRGPAILGGNSMESRGDEGRLAPGCKEQVLAAALRKKEPADLRRNPSLRENVVFTRYCT
jgi:hypothetical protein